VRILLGALILIVSYANADESSYSPLSESEIDALVEKTREAFNIPGIALGIIQDGKVEHARGYGVRSIHSPGPVTADTLFQIASNTKSMTAAALAILIDEGKLSWDDRVVDHLPEFRLYDAWVTREFTVRDLLTHRSGLPLGAGDLLFFPERHNTNINDVFRAIAHIKPVTSFRSGYAYDNLLYILAGEVVSRVSGMPWSEFVETQLFAPLGMVNCRATHRRVPSDANRAVPHVVGENGLQTAGYFNSEFAGPAGGVNASVNEMMNWVMTQLNHGKMPGGQRLFSRRSHAEMWKPVTITAVVPPRAAGDKVRIRMYALGWKISEHSGFQTISHTGGLEGMLTTVLMVPEKRLGIMVFTNQQAGLARQAILSVLLQGLLERRADRTFDDYVTASEKKSDAALATMAAAWADRDADSPPSLKHAAYAGVYSDPWYGNVEIREHDGELRFESAVSPRLAGRICHFQHNTFVVEWDDRTMMADAYLRFEVGIDGRVERLEMKGFDPRIDFSYDFHHLDLRPRQ